jgi:predicted ribosome quality control (RQC) complex YloA/Tae2 family protein
MDDQTRPTPAEDWRNDLAVPPPPDHNAPPEKTLAEALVEETAPLKARAEALLAGAARAIEALRTPLAPDDPLRVTDRDTAERVTLLAGMMIDHGKQIEAARVERGAPFLASTRTVNGHFQRLRADLVGVDPKVTGGEAKHLKGLVDDFYAEEERKAEAERRRLEAEARRAAEAAAAAERDRLAAEAAAREAALKGDVTTALAQSGARVEAEVRQNQLAGDARRLSQQAAETRAVPINTGYGVAAHRTTRYKVEITNLRVALLHAKKLNEPAIRAAVQDIYDRQARAGVRVLPGANVVPDRGMSIRTRA